MINAKPRARRAVALALVMMGAGSMGCSDSTALPALTTDPLLTVGLNVRSVTMSTVAPYNTIQVTATPRSASGAVLSDSIETTYLTENATLSVSPAGLVTAVETTPRTWVAVSAHDLRRNVTRTDTVFVMVTAASPSSPLASLVIQRAPDDSAKIGVYDGGTGLYPYTVVVAAAAEDGTDLTPSVPVAFSVSDSSIATVDPQFGIVKGIRLGTVIVRATTTYYGTTKTDSIQLTIGHPIVATITAAVRASSTVTGEYVREFVPSNITIGVGGTILFAQGIWFSGPAPSMDVVFDEPGSAQPSPIPPEVLAYPNGSGDIGPIPALFQNGAINPDCLLDFAACQGALRSFPVTGTYHYHSALFGTKGVIVVADP